MDGDEEPADSRFIICVEDISNVWAILKPVSSFLEPYAVCPVEIARFVSLKLLMQKQFDELDQIT